MEIIDTQYRDGRPDEHREAENLASTWDALAGCDSGIQYAVYRVPRRSGDGHRVYSTFGIPRDEQAGQDARRAAQREDDTKAALDRMYAARDWTWSPGDTSHHL